MTAMSPCRGCARHVRDADDHCPFCGAAREADGASPALPPAPRARSRAWLTALGATLTLGACREHATGVPSSVSVAPPREAPHPLIAAPYGAPPPPDDTGPIVRAPVWHVTLPDPIPMAARATTPLEISARNLYDTPVPSGRDRVTMRVNGAPSPALELAFGNGVRAPDWDLVPPHATARDQRMVLETIMPAPGEYFIELFIDGRRVAGRRVTVTP